MDKTRHKEFNLAVKMIYRPFYLESQYKKVLKKKDLTKAEKLDALCGLFYFYFKKAFNEVINIDYRNIVLYNTMSDDGFYCEEESLEVIKNKRAEQKTIELADNIVGLDANKDDLSKVSPSTKNMFILAINVSLGITEDFDYAMLKTKFLDIKKQELENQREQ